MACEVLRLTGADDSAPLARAAAVLRRGGLVAFPTETVYGLGANALDAEAVAGIFAAKGRPATNPLIVHVADAQAARALVRAWPAAAHQLAEHFWPGPLTLVLPRNEGVSDLVTAGGPTIAVRVPAHPVALALLRACGLPLAAPSANSSMQLSPTRAEHVLHDLAERIDLVLDAGPTRGGLESTVLDLTTEPPRLLRPGLIPPAALEAIIGSIARHAAAADRATPLRSPGQMERHYAPRTRLETAPAPAVAHVRRLLTQGLRVGWLTWSDAPCPEGVLRVVLAADPVGYAAEFYEALHRLDRAGLDRIVVDLPPAGEDWLAIHDRLRRASASA
jgi:L-threonylcarbamoyladenylate synthase